MLVVATPTVAALHTSLKPTHHAGPVRAGRLESLPKWVNLIPMVAQWLWLSIKYRSITLPSCSNPSVLTGGMVGEGKMDYFDIMGEQARAFVTPTACVTCAGEHSIEEVEDAMTREVISYPIVVKPNLGWCGFGVRRVDDRSQLRAYLRAYPHGEQILIQNWLPEPGEAGIFYMRHPNEARGQVIGLLLRQFPRVVGDGMHTVGELMARDPRVCRRMQSHNGAPCRDLTTVPQAGEVVRLATVASTRVGGLYLDASALITQELTAVMDKISQDMKGFHVGRFDVKFSHIDALRAGRGFSIIEVNGAGSEAVHAWDPALTLRQAYGIVFAKQRRLFAIGDAMRRQGHAPVGWRALLRHHLKQQALIARYPPSN